MYRYLATRRWIPRRLAYFFAERMWPELVDRTEKSKPVEW